MAGLNFADTWEAVATQLPDAPAQVQGDRRITWGEFDRRADGIAKTLLESGVERQDKVAQYLYNCPEYLESMFGICKASLVPVNTNYRYGSGELVYLWDNADAVAVVFHGTFTERIEEIKNKVDKVRLWLWVDDGSGPCPSWAVPYEDAAASATERVKPDWGRSGDDIYMLYTGGTTGMPKGVMWRQGDLGGGAALTDPKELEGRYTVPGGVGMPACPLMHGTGALVSFLVMSQAGCIVTLPSRSFDVEELLTTIEREKVGTIAIVGDAFAKPMLEALENNPGRWDISSLRLVVSSGVMWSEPVKKGLLKHHPGMILSDNFSSSEALGMGSSTSTGDNVTSTAKFQLGASARVLKDDGTDVEPGSGDIGMVAVKGTMPMGYYKDEEKTASTFRIVDGERYVIPGDYATVEADGTLRLMGRGSVCINTGGEKVFPEEVEEALKEHPAVRDAAVVGVPDEKFGEAITGMVELHPGADASEADLIAHVKQHLSSFKAPKRVFLLDSVGRAPNGKLDYGRLKDDAVARVTAST